MDRSEAPSGVATFGNALSVVSLAGSDVGASRERLRRRRLWKLSLTLGVPTAFLWYRVLVGRPFDIFRLPHIDWLVAAPVLFFVLLIGALLVPYMFAGRSPHVLFRPEQIDVRLADIKGIDTIKEEVVRSLNLFLAHKTFAAEMGGRPRRGLLFEGAPGTGKTFTAKAMAAEAGVPFLFVSATSFQSMFYGATARKIRSFFAELRKAARQEGGAIGFIEEIDAIGAARGGLSSATPTEIGRMVSGCQGGSLVPGVYAAPAIAADRPIINPNGLVSEGVGGVVNELLVQMQSFDEPTGLQKLSNKMVDAVNLLLPLDRQLRKPAVTPTNVLLIAATNRADKLDPALLRPGRFDRKLSFELPDKRGRRELIEHFLGKKAHSGELEEADRVDALAAATNGYSPVMIEHIFDEALVNAVRRGEAAMTWADVEQARLTEEVGLGQPVSYTDYEKRLIATHEAGHATIAHLIAPQRRLEILSIIKRRSALGLLAHGDREEVYTRSRSEMLALIQIAMGGQCAEEIFFGDVSTGPGGDLLSATNLAAQMVGAVGMTGTLISYAAVQNSAFHDTNIVGRVLADAEGRARVEELLQEQKQKARELLLENRHLVEALRDALLERNELIGPQITDVLAAASRGETSPPAQPGRVIDLRRAEEATQV